MYIEDIFLIWSGSPTELCQFRWRLENANNIIKLEWQGTPSAEDAFNPAKFDQYQYRQVNFLDLDITIVYSDGSADFAFKVYRKRYCIRCHTRICPAPAVPTTRDKSSGLAQGLDAQAVDTSSSALSGVFLFKKTQPLY
jgi:hypothetical protein